MLNEPFPSICSAYPKSVERSLSAEADALEILGERKNSERIVLHSSSVSLYGTPDVLQIDHNKKIVSIGEIKCPKKSTPLHVVNGILSCQL